MRRTFPECVQFHEPVFLVDEVEDGLRKDLVGKKARDQSASMIFEDDLANEIHFRVELVLVNIVQGDVDVR